MADATPDKVAAKAAKMAEKKVALQARVVQLEDKKKLCDKKIASIQEKLKTL